MGLKGNKRIKRLKRIHYQLLSATSLAPFKSLTTIASLVSRLKRRHYQLLSETSLVSFVSLSSLLSLFL